MIIVEYVKRARELQNEGEKENERKGKHYLEYDKKKTSSSSVHR